MDPRKLSTEELLRLLLTTRDEDLRAKLWVEFWRCFQPVTAGVIVKRIFRHIKRVDRELVEDLVQETFFKICRNDFKTLRNFKFQHENALHGFLKVVAANLVEDYFRKKELPSDGEEDMEVVPAPPGPLPPDKRILIQEVETCLQQLADEPNFARDSKIFWLYYRDGYTAQAISQLPDIGLTVKGVESTLLRLIKWLRDKLTIKKS